MYWKHDKPPKIGETIWDGGQRMVVLEIFSDDHPTYPQWILVDRCGKKLIIDQNRVSSRNYNRDFFIVATLKLFGSWEKDTNILDWPR